MTTRAEYERRANEFLQSLSTVDLCNYQAHLADLVQRTERDLLALCIRRLDERRDSARRTYGVEEEAGVVMSQHTLQKMLMEIPALENG